MDASVVHEDNDLFALVVRVALKILDCLVKKVLEEHPVDAAFHYLASYHFPK